MQRRQAAWIGGIAMVLAATSMAANGQTTERVSIAASGSQPIGGRYAPRPSVSGDGTTVAFESPITTLVPGDTNGIADLFVSFGGAVVRVPAVGGAQPNCTSQRASVSYTGQFIAFDSCASNLVAGDNNGASDVFVYDRVAQTVTRVSLSSAEVQGNGPSFSSAISPNGQFVAFLTQATSLEAGTTTGTHVALRDLVNGNTFIVSRASGVAGTLGSSDVRPSVADDGTVAFSTISGNMVAGDSNNSTDVFLRLGATGGSPTTVRVSLSAAGTQIAGASTRPSISADAQRVTFETALAAATGDGNGLTDVYLRDVTTGTTLLVSRTPVGSAGNGNSIEASIAPGGQHVSFTSQAADLDGVFDSLQDVFRATLSAPGAAPTVTSLVKVSVSTASPRGDSAASDAADTGRVVFSSDESLLVAGDLNGDTDVFSTDSTTITRVSVTGPGLTESYSGLTLRPAPSYDGTIVAFVSSASNLVANDTNSKTDVFVRNRLTGVTERLPIAAGFEGFDADWVTISHDGRFIAYNRAAAFLYDRYNGTTTTISVAAPGGSVSSAAQPRISASGRYVAYVTAASFDPADTNSFADVYRYDRITGENVLASRAATGGSTVSNTPAISGDGKLVAFVSSSPNLAAGDTNGLVDAFVRNMETGVTTRLSTNLLAGSSLEGRDVFVSPDGNYVAFLLTSTIPTNEANAASSVFVARSDGSGLRGPFNGLTEGAGTTQGAYDPTISLFGRFLSFRSYSPDLTVPDSNSAADVFARQILGAPTAGVSPPLFGAVQRISVNGAGAEATGGNGLDTENPEIIGTAKAIVFQSGFNSLVAGDTNFIVDAFIRAGIFGNGECDYIEATYPGYTAFLAQYGLDPCSNGGSPFADPDGDGQTNVEELTTPGGPTNPVLGDLHPLFRRGRDQDCGPELRHAHRHRQPQQRSGHG